MSDVVMLAGLVCLVAAAFLVAVPAGVAALGVSLMFVGWASSTPTPKE